MGLRIATPWRMPYEGESVCERTPNFDNEEIVRHFRARGATVCYARDFFILKRPPTFRKWLDQRPRQAYEDFVMRIKSGFLAS